MDGWESGWVHTHTHTHLLSVLHNKILFLMIIRTDQIRHKEGLEAEDDLFEVLVNPYASDKQLLYALKHADEDELERAARFACDLQLQKSLGWPESWEGLLDIFQQIHVNVCNQFEATKVLSKAANNNWELAERIMVSLANQKSNEL